MAMNPNVGMANMNPMGGPVGGAPMPMMNNGTMNPQAAAAAAARQHQLNNESQRTLLNTYIYEYFIRYGMYDCARTLLHSDGHQVNVDKEAAARRNGNSINGAEDPMDTDSKDDIDSKLPEDLPPPKLPVPQSDSSFLYEWFCLFWDIHNAQRTKSGNGTVNQYVAHTQQQSRQKQNEQQAMLRQMRPDQFQAQQQLMRNMQNGQMNPMNMKQGTLARTAMANNQNPQMQMLQQQAKQNQMQPAGMDPNRERPTSPASGEGAPSPSKRQRVEGQPFNPSQAVAMMANGRPVQGMPGQPMANQAAAAAAAHQMLSAHGINPNSLNHQQLQQFIVAGPGAQQKSIAAYSQNLQQQQGAQMPNKQMPNGAPQGQGSPSMQMQNAPELAAFYNAADIGGPNAMGRGANGAPGPAGAGSNHALQDYQMQLMLLEQQNKKRLMMARQEQDNIGGPTPGQQGVPGQNGQPFPDSSTSPNPADQMKRGTPQMNSSGIPSPVPEGGQSRGSPNPGMNFMGNVDPNMAPHFSMAAAQAQMNGMRPPSSHPGQPFNGQPVNPQMMARQQQAQQAQQQQPGGQGNPQQWQQGPNGQMMQQGMPQNPQMQGTPQQRSMPPPSAPAAAGNGTNSRTTASPQQAAAAPPTPNQTNKAGPKGKKETKNAKKANSKKSNQNLNNAAATPAGESEGDAAPPTPITPVNPGNFAKNGQNGGVAGQPSAAPAPVQTTASVPPPSAGIPQGGHDPNQNGGMGMDNFGSMMEFSNMELANPSMSTDVLSEFDFDSFLHDGDANAEPFDFNGAFAGMEGGEIGAE